MTVGLDPENTRSQNDWQRFINSTLHRMERQVDMLQDEIYDHAEALTGKFMSARSGKAKGRKNKDQWSDLTIQVRRLRGTVTIHWRHRQWFKTHEGKSSYTTRHIRKNNREGYAGSLRKLAGDWEMTEVIALEREFETLRKTSSSLLKMKHMAVAMRRLFHAEGMNTAVNGDIEAPGETVHHTIERAASLLTRMEWMLWPQRTAADVEAGFVPAIAESSGANPTTVDAPKADAMIRQAASALEALGTMLNASTAEHQ